MHMEEDSDIIWEFKCNTLNVVGVLNYNVEVLSRWFGVPSHQPLWTRLIKMSSRVWVQNENNNISAGLLTVPTGPSGDCLCSIKVLLVNLPIYYRNLNCYN